MNKCYKSIKDHEQDVPQKLVVDASRCLPINAWMNIGVA